MPLVFFILKIIPSTRDAALGIQWVLRMIPSFAFGYGVQNIGQKELFSRVIYNKAVQSSLSLDVAGGDIIFMAWTGVLYFLLIFLIERVNSTGELNKLFNKEGKIEYQHKIYDEGN